MKTEQQTPHWIPCPVCNEKTDIKIYADTALFNFPLQCPHCHNETLINSRFPCKANWRQRN